MSDPWIPALTAVIVAVVSAASAWAARKDTREGDFRDDYLGRLSRAEARADEAVSKVDALLAENERLRSEVAHLRNEVARLEAAHNDASG